MNTKSTSQKFVMLIPFQWITLSLLCLFIACTHTPTESQTEEKSRPQAGVKTDTFESLPRYSFTNAADETLESGRETLAIVGLNDIHGALDIQKFKTRDKAAIAYERGGATILTTQIKILRAEYGSRLIILDAGDEFQGSLDSNLEEGAPMVQFFNELGLTAAAIGNHEFDFGPKGPDPLKLENVDVLGALKARLSEAAYPYLAANIYDKKTGHLAELPNTVPSTLIQAGRTKVGIIGLSTLETPTTTRASFVAPLDFKSLKEATLRESRKLREKGAQVILITAHVGIHCSPSPEEQKNGGGLSAFPNQILSAHATACDSSSEMVELLNSLPGGTVDAVVSGHSHSIIHHWVNGVPVIQGGTRNTYFNTIYLTYNHKSKQVERPLTRIEGPNPICTKVFNKSQDCDGNSLSELRGDLLQPAQFHNQTVTEDERMTEILAPVFKKTEALKKKIIGQAAKPIEHIRHGESELGNLATDAIRQAVKADFSILNGGGLRANLEQGPITYEALFKAMPFDNFISILKVTGKELKLILRVAESGSKGVFSVSGLKLKLKNFDLPLPPDDLNKDGKKEEWETNRLVSVTTSDGKPILNDHYYTLATVDFLVTGGDYMSYPMSTVDKKRIQMAAGGIIRDVIVDYIEKQSPLNTETLPLIDLKKPRIQFTQ